MEDKAIFSLKIEGVNPQELTIVELGKLCTSFAELLGPVGLKFEGIRAGSTLITSSVPIETRSDCLENIQYNSSNLTKTSSSVMRGFHNNHPDAVVSIVDETDGFQKEIYRFAPEEIQPTNFVQIETIQGQVISLKESKRGDRIGIQTSSGRVVSAISKDKAMSIELRGFWRTGDHISLVGSASYAYYSYDLIHLKHFDIISYEKVVMTTSKEWLTKLLDLGRSEKEKLTHAALDNLA